MLTLETRSDWYNRVSKEIAQHRDSLSQKDVKKYKLDLLLRVVGRVDDLSSTCGECQLLQQEIPTLIQSLGNMVYLPKPDAKTARKSYFKLIDTITKHLKKKHKLVTEGYYKGIGMLIGGGIGTVLGAVLDNAGIGAPSGLGIGLAIGSYLDKKAQKEGRVI